MEASRRLSLELSQDINDKLRAKKSVDNDTEESSSQDLGEQTSKLESSLSSRDDDGEESADTYQQLWTKTVLNIAYAVLIFAAFVESFAGDSTSGLASYATSNFNAHTLISTAAVVYKITAIMSYPVFGKLHYWLGKSSGFGLSVLIYTLSYVMYAACRNAQTYVCAEILYAVGKIGYRVFQQVFIADTTSLINRGFWSQFPDAIATVPALYVGSVIQDSIIDHSTWRWGYGIWAIIMFFSCCVLTLVMFYLDHLHKVKAKQLGTQVKKQSFTKVLLEGSKGSDNIFKKIYYVLFIKLDLFGGLLMLTGMTLFFVPLTLTGAKSTYKWHEPKLIAMLVVGGVLFIAFLVWNSKVARYPFIQHNAFTHAPTMIACIIAALDFCENSAYSQYMKTVLQVSKYVSVGEAVRIDDSKKACVQVFGVVAGILMKYTKRSKIFVLTSIPLLFLGHALLVHFINTNDGEAGVANRGYLYMAEVFIGAGRGIYQCALQVIIQGMAGKQNFAMSTAFFLLFNSVGSLIGTCIAGGIWNTVVLNKLEKYLPAAEKSAAKKIYKSLTVALKFKKGTVQRIAIARAYRETQQLIGWVTLGVIVPMLILMWFVDDIKLTDKLDVYEGEEQKEKEEKEKDLKVVGKMENN
ncbi:hypothetical protein DASC09_047970 [Saccharomycopsis crataegensis]|uniref:Siderophore iron transporter mirA n=1 Tax=Saccharomycopsis crataegensis TaxID=43959 RepID=A0AAV5QSB6_9ASCO|nr:hypothetical protein DASC09_047970 [Saccharomycopsis crataegensis]